jgi:hypothetical protein
MNIRQYYERSAIASIHAALIALIPAIGLLVYIFLFSKQMELILLITPFLIYSFSCYMKFLQNHKRANAVQMDSIDEKTTSNCLLSNTTFLITLAPAPSLRLQLFHCNGIKAGELRDFSTSFVKWFIPKFLDIMMVRKYGLYNERDELIAYYLLYRDQIATYINSEGGKDQVYSGVRQKNIYQFQQQAYQIEKNGIQDFSIVLQSTKNKVGQIQTGWMPLEWNQRFIDVNTPIFRLHESLSKEERLQIFSILILTYAYHNH